MAPYKDVVFHAYGRPILIAYCVLFLNVFGAALLLQRKFLLKDTGRKLSHLDRQFQIGQSNCLSSMNVSPAHSKAKERILESAQML